jgi:catechol 2,3-dioxygenase-like lactoylglutathione lyase family enzyme
MITYLQQSKGHAHTFITVNDVEKATHFTTDEFGIRPIDELDEAVANGDVDVVANVPGETPEPLPMPSLNFNDDAQTVANDDDDDSPLPLPAMCFDEPEESVDEIVTSDGLPEPLPLPSW